MFSKDITTSDAFREMPTSSQALYFHLGMEADDDGFLDNYKGLMRAVNATEDDLRILIAKRFLILFPSKVVVVKHWLINNTVRKDRYSETKHLDEKRALIVKENGSYTEDSGGLPSGNQTATQYRIEEDRKGSALEDSPRVVEVSELSEESTRVQKPPKYPNAREVFSWFPQPEPSWKLNTTELKHAELLYLRGEKKVRSALAYAEKHMNDDFFYSITSPSELERKWTKLVNHKPA
jgi:hypothetical protein